MIVTIPMRMKLVIKMMMMMMMMMMTKDVEKDGNHLSSKIDQYFGKIKCNREKKIH